MDILLLFSSLFHLFFLLSPLSSCYWFRQQGRTDCRVPWRPLPHMLWVSVSSHYYYVVFLIILSELSKCAGLLLSSIQNTLKKQLSFTIFIYTKPIILICSHLIRPRALKKRALLLLYSRHFLCTPLKHIAYNDFKQVDRSTL